MTDSRQRPSLQRFVQGLVWLAVAVGFGHLFLNTTRPPAADLRAWFAVAGAVSLALAGATWLSQARVVRFVSGVAATATVFLELALIALDVAHETGVVLLAGGALNAAVAVASFWTGGGSSVASDTDGL